MRVGDVRMRVREEVRMRVGEADDTKRSGD